MTMNECPIDKGPIGARLLSPYENRRFALYNVNDVTSLSIVPSLKEALFIQHCIVGGWDKFLPFHSQSSKIEELRTWHSLLG